MHPINKKIRDIMDAKGVKQTTIAKKLDMAQNTFSERLKKDKTFDIDQLAIICGALGLGINELTETIGILDNSLKEPEPVYETYDYDSQNLSLLKIKIQELEVIRVGLSRELREKDRLIGDLRSHIATLKGDTGNRKTGQFG